jgi:hypothetical protein
MCHESSTNDSSSRFTDGLGGCATAVRQRPHFASFRPTRAISATHQAFEKDRALAACLRNGSLAEGLSTCKALIGRKLLGLISLWRIHIFRSAGKLTCT